MVDDDVLFRFRLRLFSLAAELGNVREACRLFGRPPLHLLPLAGPGPAQRPRDAATPRAPAAADAQPDEPARRAARRGLQPGPPRARARGASAPSLAQERWGGLVISPNGVWRVLARGTASVAARQPPVPRGRLRGPARTRAPAHPSPSATSRSTTRASSWASTASTWAASAARRDGSGSTPPSTSPRASSGPSCTRRRSTRPRGTRAGLARRVAADLAAHGWRLERVLTDNGSEFRSSDFGDTLRELGATQTFIRAGPAGHQRRGRAGAAHDPRGVLATGLRAQPRAQARRPRPGPRELPALLQRGARPHRPAHPAGGPPGRRSSERAR